MAYTKRPSKDELYERISELERANQRLIEERDREKTERWNKLLPQAYSECRRMLNATFPNLVTLLHFEHVDEGGYWFTFELVNNKTRQTFAVRHSDISFTES